MQSQLDYAASNGAFWEEVSRLLGSSINADGTLKANSELVDLLKVTDEFKALSYFGGKVWIDDLIQAWLVALEGKANLESEYKTTPTTTTPNNYNANNAHNYKANNHNANNHNTNHIGASTGSLYSQERRHFKWNR